MAQDVFLERRMSRRDFLKEAKQLLHRVLVKAGIERERFEGPEWETNDPSENPLIKERHDLIKSGLIYDHINLDLNVIQKKSVISPTRDQSKGNLNNLFDSLMAQDDPDFEVLLVGGADDKGWKNLSAVVLEWGGLDLSQKWYIHPNPKSLSKNAAKVRVKYGKRLSIVEVTLTKVKKRSLLWGEREVDQEGRDTQIKRNVGGRLAIGEIFCYIDGKNTCEKDHLTNAHAEMREHRVEALAGEMFAMEEELHGFMEKLLVLYQEEGPIRRNPTFRTGYYLNGKTMRRVRTLPITACWFMTRSAFALMGGFDERMKISYEDFASAVRFVQNGGEFWVTNKVFVYHKHRKSLWGMILEWLRSGGGAAELLLTNPRSIFAWKRFRDVLITTVLFLFVLFGFKWIVETHQTTFLSLLGLVGIAGYAGYSSIFVQKTKEIMAALFPAMLVSLVLVFSFGFWLRMVTARAVKWLLQTMFIPVLS